MSSKSRLTQVASDSNVTVSFGERFQHSGQFDAVFREGMALVERAAAYLDGAGRQDSRGLATTITVLYATESMRLTTRLLDLASWLLIRRALKAGEITEQEAAKRRQKVKLQALGRPAHTRGFDQLPAGLQLLVLQSFALHDRIVQLDRAMFAPAVEAGDEPARTLNPVASQIGLLHEAFGNNQRLH